MAHSGRPKASGQMQSFAQKHPIPFDASQGKVKSLAIDLSWLNLAQDSESIMA